MSLIRPVWLEDLLKPRPTASPRLRGLKGFDPGQVGAFQDALYADDPSFWILTQDFAAPGAGIVNHIGVNVPADDSFLVIVDGCSASCSAVAERFNVSFGPAIAFVTDTQVFKQNRREAGRLISGFQERVGLLRIADQVFAGVGTPITTWGAPANVTLVFPLAYRLFANEQLFVQNATLNQPLTATMWGRVMNKGQR